MYNLILLIWKPRSGVGFFCRVEKKNHHVVKFFRFDPENGEIFKEYSKNQNGFYFKIPFENRRIA